MRSSGQVLDAALAGPVALTKRGRETLIILPAEQYHRLMGRPQTTAHSTYDGGSEAGRQLADAIDQTLAELGDDPK